MSEPANRALRVLIVDDELRMRELLTRAVASWGHQVRSARSAEEALRLMSQEAAQVLVVDLNLPGMDGMTCVEEVRKRWPAAQVIILTGFGDLDAARKAIHLDVVEFLTKPCHLGELEQAIGRAMRRLADIAAAEQAAETEEPDADDAAPPSDRGSAPPPTLEEVEREHILAALARHNGNRSAAAEELGISLRTLYYRLKEYQRQGR